MLVIIKHVYILFEEQKEYRKYKFKLKTEDGRSMLWLKCVVYGSKKSRFIKEQEAKGLLSSIGLKYDWIKFRY